MRYRNSYRRRNRRIKIILFIIIMILFNIVRPIAFHYYTERVMEKHRQNGE